MIQVDDPIFLFETIRVLEKCRHQLKDFDLTFLVAKDSYLAATTSSLPLIKGITFRPEEILNQTFDVSVNLSLDESGWDIQGKVKAKRKLGPERSSGRLQVPDLWSTFFLTIKNKTPFLTFHLQQIYRCILGLHHSTLSTPNPKSVSRIAYGAMSTSLFPSEEQEKFVTGIVALYPGAQVVDVSEVDLVEDVSQTLYLGPPTLESLKLCEAGGRGVFFTSHFQGFNLIPSTAGNLLISAEGKSFSAEKLLVLLYNLKVKGTTQDLYYPVYEVEEGNFNGPYLRSYGKSDLNYPFYQAHVVLWNFLLNLSDVELKISEWSNEQLSLLESHLHVVSKFLRLHDYALHSVEKIYQMTRKGDLSVEDFKDLLKTLSDTDSVSENLSSSHSFLRPLFNFYKIRKSQGTLANLAEEAQASILIYSEEHQAFAALKELFSVTLKKNEVNI